MSSKRLQYVEVLMQDAASATGDGSALNVDGYGGFVLQLTGTFTATVTFEATIDGSNWVALALTPIGGGAGSTTATSAGIFYSAVRGLARVRARISAYTSGSVTVLGRAVAA